MTRTALLLFTLALSGCALLPSSKVLGEQGSGVRSEVVLRFDSPLRVHQICSAHAKERGAAPVGFHAYYQGCARVVEIEPGVTSCEVVVSQPKDFADTTALALLGHEVWHCFGATHAKP